MNLIRSATGGLLRFAVVATFAWAAGTDAYGSEACLHHDAVPDAGGHGYHVPDAYVEAHPVAESSDHHSEEGHGDGPCTCITHCQAPGGDLSLPAAVNAVVRAPDIAVSMEPPVLRSAVLGPRHHLFELHLPNAPPIPA